MYLYLVHTEYNQLGVQLFSIRADLDEALLYIANKLTSISNSFDPKVLYIKRIEAEMKEGDLFLKTVTGKTNGFCHTHPELNLTLSFVTIDKIYIEEFKKSEYWLSVLIWRTMEEFTIYQVGVKYSVSSQMTSYDEYFVQVSESKDIALFEVAKSLKEREKTQDHPKVLDIVIFQIKGIEKNNELFINTVNHRPGNNTYALLDFDSKSKLIETISFEDFRRSEYWMTVELKI